MEVRPGMRLRSVVCATEVVVVTAPTPTIDLRCGGHPMAPTGADAAEGLELVVNGGTLLGKRYTHDGTGLEVLCTKAGDGGLTVGDDPVPVKAPRALPSSD